MIGIDAQAVIAAVVLVAPLDSAVAVVGGAGMVGAAVVVAGTVVVR